MISVLVLTSLLASCAALVQGQAPDSKPADPVRADTENLPDLVPILRKPMNGHLTVKNIGKGLAGPSKLTLDCQKEGLPPEIGACPNLPPEVAATYFDPAFPMNATIRVPALAPGATFTHTLSFWGTFQWPSGKYKFTAVVDAAHALHESTRENNIATSTLVVP
jgi:hypothetical protein